MQTAVLLRLASRLVFQIPATLLVCSEKLWERVHQDLEQKSTCIDGTVDNTCDAHGCLDTGVGRGLLITGAELWVNRGYFAT